MACRKNAYRGMQGMSEYLDKRNREAAIEEAALEEERRKVWTPPSLLEQCCLQWLSHGPHKIIRSGNGVGLASVTRGCSGGCARAHPKIRLDFEGGAATAYVSHALDPFTRFFKYDAPLKTDDQSLKYQLDGLLSDYHDRIKQKFGAHLVTVEHRALAASQRACERQLEEEEILRAAKKRKVLGEAAPVNLLDSVLEICYDHCLRDHLDVADIAWMRTSCKSMGRIAARMARDRMGAFRLSYTPYIPTSGELADGFEMDMPDHRPLSLDPTNDNLSVLRPGEPQQQISWSYSDGEPSHIRIEVHLEKERSDMPERRVLFGGHEKRLEVARYLINSRQFREEGEVREAQSNVQNQVNMEGSLQYRVTSCALDDNFLGDPYGNGTISLQSIKFTFNDFLGVYVRMRLYKAKRKYKSSTIKNPADRAYIKALAKAAREAPGDACSFRRMEGWDCVYR